MPKISVLYMDQIVCKINLDIILDNVVKYAIDRNIFYYDSMENYLSRQEPTLWRKTKFYLKLLVLVIYTVKFGLLSLYPDKLFWTLLKDVTIIFGKQANLLHALCFSFGLVTLVGKLIIVYHESRKNLKVLDLIVDLKAHKSLYRLNQTHRKKITMNAFIVYYGFIRIIGSIEAFIVSLMIIMSTLVTYLYHDYGNVAILWFWSIFYIIAFDEVHFTLLIATFLFFIPITLLNYLFDELIVKLRVSIRRNNQQDILQVLQSYNELIAVVQQLSGPYNMIIGLVYCFLPYIIAINIELIKIKSNDLLFKCLRWVFFILFIGTNIAVFMINQLSASITVRNKSIHKYLYPMFINGRNIKLRIKLKIDSFIDRLHNQFIGFYCFNLFQFTKMAFYQYAFSV